MNTSLLPTLTMALALTSAPTALADTAVPERPTVDLAICLDTSGSMDGLIDAARRNIWAVVNDLALAEPTPQLRIALLTFGNDGHDEAAGWVKVHAPLTENLDVISQELFAQHTDGGTELVARVVDRAVNTLDWGSDTDALKIIIVAGNEGADQDKEISYKDACKRAISKGIMVNSIYCGGVGDSEAAAWREVSMLADGSFATIDQDSATVEIPTPFDTELTALNEAINGTYLAFGREGATGQQRQWAEDSNAVQLGTTAALSRVACKAGALYDNSRWDLVDACSHEDFDLESLEEKDLPEEMREMTLEERKAFVKKRQDERTALNDKVAVIVPQREAFIAKEKARLAIDESKSLGKALRAAIRAQAGAKGVHIPAPPAPPKAAEAATSEDATDATTAEAGGS